MDAGTAGIVGTLGGVIITAVSSHFGSRADRNEARANFLAELRREAYTNFITQAQASSLATAERESNLVQLKELFMAWGPVSMYGSKAADEFAGTVFGGIQHYVLEDRSEDVHAAVWERIGQFKDLARNELGIGQ